MRNTGMSVARTIAGFLGVFSLLNVLGNLRAPRFDATIWWLDLRWLPTPCDLALAAGLGVALLGFALRPHMSDKRRLATVILIALAVGIAVANAATFYALLLRGAIGGKVPIPISLLITAMLAIVLAAARRRSAKPVRLRVPATLATLAFLLAAAPLLQMLCFGTTDYRRPADAVVVFGARVYADGRPSDALADRMRTACELVTNGWAEYLIVSGGPGDGPVHETDTMRRLAIEHGVRADRIITDRAGINTSATVANTVPLFNSLRARRVLAVSHGYHLPRIKLAYQRQGREVYTVPARETYVLRALPYFLAREAVAQWAYYLQPLACRPAASEIAG